MLAGVLIGACAGSPERSPPNDTPVPPQPPAPASPAALTPCPSGWRVVPGPEAGDAATCEPWPETGYQACAIDAAHFPGRAGCERIGSLCPAGDWAEELPSGPATLFVSPTAAPGGDGSRPAPFASLHAALAAAPEGAVIALAKGTYTETVTLSHGVTLWGACVAETVLTAPGPENQPAVLVRTAGARLGNLRLEAPRIGVWLDGAGWTATLDDLVITGAHVVGLAAFNGARVSGARVVIRDTAPLSGTTDYGQGLEVGTGATIELDEVALLTTRDTAALVHGEGSFLALRDAVIADTDGATVDVGAAGHGMVVTLAAQAAGERLVFERNRKVSLYVDDAAQVTLTDTVIRDTRPSRDEPDDGGGVLVGSGAHLALQSSLVERSRMIGLFAYAASATLTDVVVRGTLPAGGSQTLGNGLLAQAGAELVVTRCAVEGNHNVGLSAEGVGTRLVATDITVRRTRRQLVDGLAGSAFVFTDAASATVSRAVVDDNECGAVVANGGATELLLADAIIRGTHSCAADGLDGRGLVVQFGASVIAQRLLVEQNRGAGVLVAKVGSVLRMSDTLVQDTRGAEVNGESGDGLHVQERAVAELNRVLLRRNREVGLFVAVDAVVNGSDVVVEDTQPTECPPELCLYRAGIGAIATDRAYLNLRRFVLRDNVQAGLVLASDGAADLAVGEVRSNGIGVNSMVPGFDLTRLQHEVVFADNGRNLDTVELPLPPVSLDP